jgi:hypothetical protein
MKLIRITIDQRTRDLFAKRVDILHKQAELRRGIQKERYELRDALRDINQKLVRSLSDDELDFNITRLEQSTDQKNQPRFKRPLTAAHREEVRRWDARRERELKQLSILEIESANRARKATIARKKREREQRDAEAKFTKELDLKRK